MKLGKNVVEKSNCMQKDEIPQKKQQQIKRISKIKNANVATV